MPEYARTVSLQDSTGRYLCALENGGGAVVCDRDKVGPWETFRWVEHDDGNGWGYLITGGGFVLTQQDGAFNAESYQLLDMVRLEPIGDGKVAILTSHETYVTSDQGDNPHVRCNATVIGEWERFTLHDHRHGHPPARRVPGESGSSFRPLAGPIRADGRCFVDDNGPWPAIGISLFWAPWAYQHDRERLDRAIDWALGAGCTYARVFASIDWGHQGHTAPVDIDDDDNTWETIDYLGDRGLRTHLTLISRRNIVQRRASYYADRWAELSEGLRDRLMLVEMANEASHPGNRNDVREMADLCKRFSERSEVLCCPSAPHGSRDLKEQVRELYDGSGARCMSIHYDRHHGTSEGEWRPVRQPRHTAHGGWTVPIIDGEPRNYNKPGDERMSVAACAASRATALICGCGATTHHDRPGVWTDVEYSTQPHAQELQAAIRCVAEHMPADIANWQRFRAGEDGHPFPSVLPQHWSFIGQGDYRHEDPSSGHGVSRAFAATSGDRFVMVLAGVRKHVRLRESKPMRIYSLNTGQEVRFLVGGEVRVLHQSQAEAFLVVSA